MPWVFIVNLIDIELEYLQKDFVGEGADGNPWVVLH
jgi:hypothetical protein